MSISLLKKVYEEFDKTEDFGDALQYQHYKLNENNNMSKFFNWNLKDVVSALMSSLLMALIAVLGYVMQVGDIFGINLRTLTNIGVMAGLTGIVSLLKTLLTTSEGNFLGGVSIK